MGHSSRLPTRFASDLKLYLPKGPELRLIQSSRAKFRVLPVKVPANLKGGEGSIILV